MHWSEVEPMLARSRSDAVLVGSGMRKDNGAVQIRTIALLHGLAPGFVDDYAEIADVDTVGRLFAERPTLVQTVCVEDYRKQRGPQAAMAAYLGRFHIRHLMLAGLESRLGLAWVTLYRRHLDERYTADDVEWARYEVPAALYRWQCRSHAPTATALPTRQPPSLPLSPRELQVLLLHTRGEPTKWIADTLGLSLHYVRGLIRDGRAKLGVRGGRITLEDLAR